MEEGGGGGNSYSYNKYDILFRSCSFFPSLCLDEERKKGKIPLVFPWVWAFVQNFPRRLEISKPQNAFVYEFTSFI